MLTLKIYLIWFARRLCLKKTVYMTFGFIGLFLLINTFHIGTYLPNSLDIEVLGNNTTDYYLNNECGWLKYYLNKCHCSRGFHGDGFICKDVNECKQTVRICGNGFICENNFGSFECSCGKGYFLNDMKQCQDLDECAVEPPCDKDTSICLNTPGSYKCQCKKDHVEIEGQCHYDPETCAVRHINGNKHPDCQNKINWMKKFWNTNRCYAMHGITGSHCSILSYLSEVELVCPLIKGRKERKDIKTYQYADLDVTNLKYLTSLVLHDEKSHEWMRKRLASMWKDWLEAYVSLKKKQNLNKRKKNNVIVFIGILVETNWHWAQKAKSGGPLGELVQWTDLIAVLYLLGHRVFVPTSVAQIKLRETITQKGCQQTNVVSMENADLIYVDTHGLSILKKHFDYTSFKCKVRIVDSFGTEARFNTKLDFDKQNEERSDKINREILTDKYGYGSFEVHLNQIMTMFPHSPDNSFLGFVVGKKKMLSADVMSEKNVALVYGKQDSQWKGMTPLLSLINKYIQVHGTVLPNDAAFKRKPKLYHVPSFVINHSIMEWKDLQIFLEEKVQIFIGLGYPFEGPAPLEAIAKGAVFLNPKWDPPISRLHDKKFGMKWFFAGKPTLREFTSQHSYMEQFIKPPYSYNVDYSDKNQIISVIKEILENFKNGKIQSHLPYEFTQEGMLQRVNAYINRQDFCSSNDSWVPLKDMSVIQSNTDESCKEACQRKDLICENSLFRHINNERQFKDSHVLCLAYDNATSLNAPYLETETGACVKQKEDMLFSCVDKNISYERLCPCRNYIKEQIALCPNCL